MSKPTDAEIEAVMGPMNDGRKLIESYEDEELGIYIMMWQLPNGLYPIYAAGPREWIEKWMVMAKEMGISGASHENPTS